MLVAGSLLCGALMVGVSAAIVSLQRASESPGLGPTAAALGEGFAYWYGAALGGLIGCAIVAAAARTGSRIATGIVAGTLGFFVIALPAIVLRRPSDVSVGDAVLFGLFEASFLLPAALVGSGLGAAAGAAVSRRRG